MPCRLTPRWIARVEDRVPSSTSPWRLAAGHRLSRVLQVLWGLALKNAAGLRWYLAANLLAFGLVAALFSGLIPVDLRAYGGAVQRLGALVMFVPGAVLCIWLLRSARPGKSVELSARSHASCPGYLEAFQSAPS